MTSSPALNGGELTRVAAEEMRPAEVDHVVSQDKAGNPVRPLPPAGQGFLQTQGADISLITWKRAEDGKGSILRFAETGGKQSEATIRLPQSHITAAALCSGVEDDKRPLPVENGVIHLSFNKFEVLTVRVITRQ